MPDLPTINAKEAEKMLLKAGFSLVRTSGSHRIYIYEGKFEASSAISRKKSFTSEDCKTGNDNHRKSRRK